MFGYMAVAVKELTEAEHRHYRAYYCGLCRALQREYGQKSRLTLSNDLTFLAILLSSLYEPKERSAALRCMLHPLQKQPSVQNAAVSYAAAMNILLTYHKLLDNREDDKSVLSAAGAKLLRGAYEKVRMQYPEKCAAVLECLRAIRALEAQESRDVDALCRLSGQMLGTVFAWKKDAWEGLLRAVGEGLGQFIYFMDAYEDYDDDLRKGRFNPLTELHRQADYEEFCLGTLKMLVADAMAAFDLLPLEKDLSILKNVMYTGIWASYARMHKEQWTVKEKADE